MNCGESEPTLHETMQTSSIVNHRVMFRFLRNVTRLCQSWRGRSNSPRSLPWQAGESISQASGGHCNVYINIVRTRSITWSSKKIYIYHLFDVQGLGKICFRGANMSPGEVRLQHEGPRRVREAPCLAQGRLEDTAYLQPGLLASICTLDSPFLTVQTDHLRSKLSRNKWCIGSNNSFRRVAELNLEIKKHGRSMWRRTKLSSRQRSSTLWGRCRR